MIYAFVRLVGLTLLVALLVGLPAPLRSQCVTPELIMINSCVEHPNPNGGPVDVESEIVIMSTGLVPVPVSSIGINLPFNGFGAENADLGVELDGTPYGCAFKEPIVTEITGCPNAIPAGPNDVIPPNAYVVVFLTGTTISADVLNTDFSNICQNDRPVYILQNDCERTSGAFANGSGQGNPLRSVSFSSPCGLRTSTYNTATLDPEDGTYYIVGTNETGNQDCNFPVLPPSCPPIDTTFLLCGYDGMVEPPVPVSEFEDYFPPEVLLISLHESPEEAELNDNRLVTYSGPTDEPDTLYARIIYSASLCTTVGRFIIRFPPTSPRIACTAEREASGPGVADGAVRIDLNQGAPPYQLVYTGAAAGAMEVNTTSVALENLPGGDYTISYTDANGCVSDTCMVNLPAGFPLSIQCLTRNNSNDANVLGSGQVTISGGEAPFNVVVADASGNTTDYPNRPNGTTPLPNLTSGTYTITVTDAQGQTETCTLNIALSACPLSVVSVQQFTTDCSGADNTIIRLTVAGNDGAITTSWSGGNGIETFNGMQEAGPLSPGLYFVTVGDQSGCAGITEGPIIVTDPGQIDFTVTGNLAASACRADARLDVTVNGGGSPPYEVVLVNRNTAVELERITGQAAGATVSFINLAGGGAPDYEVYVVDDLGCESARAFNPITAEPAPDLVLVPADQLLVPPACSGDSTGRLSLLASGGTAPYVYRWVEYPQRAGGRILTDGPQQTDLPAGNYFIEITDANGCQDSAAVVLPEGAVVTLICGPTTGATAAAGGSVILSPNGGTAPYTAFVERDGAGQPNATLGDAPELLTDLAAGNYSVVLRDVDGCRSDTCRFTIPQLSCALVATAVVDTIVCAEAPEGGIALSLTGGTAPYTFAWGAGVMGTGPTERVFAEGSYPVSIEDANGCRLDTSYFVPNLMRRTALILETPRFLPACPGEDVRVPLEFSGSGPFTLDYFINPEPDSTYFRVFTSGQRFDTLVIPASDFVGNDLLLSNQLLTDAFCESRINQTFRIAYDEPLVERRTDTLCGSEVLEIAGRVFGALNPSDTFFVNDGAACGIRYEIDLTFLSGIVPDTIVVPVCPATPYLENGEVFDANRPEGEVRYARPGLCDSVVYVRLDIFPEFIGSFSDNACVGDTIFYADRFFTAENPSGLARLPGMAATGCDSLVFVNTSFRRTGEVRLFGDFEICPGDPIELRFAYDGPSSINVRMRDAAGNVTELPGIRQGSRVEVFPTESTSYQLLSSEVGGCPGTVAGGSSVIVNDLAVEAEVLLDPVNYCQDTLGRAAVTYTGGAGPYEIAWSNGPTDSINRNLLAGTYRVSVTDAIGCTLTDSVTLSKLVPLTARVTGVPPVCPGENGGIRLDTIFGGGGFYEVSVDGQFFLPVERIADIGVMPGNHRAVFQGANDCSVAVDFFVPPALRPVFDLPGDTTIFLGDSIYLDGSLINQDSAWWTPAAFLSAPASAATWAGPPRSVNYTLHLRTLAQCLFTHEVRVTVDERLPVFAPTAFSPNGDGTNDRYELGLGRGARLLRTFRVFNRWGNLIHDGAEGWDGNFNGSPAPPAVYVYQAVVEMADGSERLLKGDFVLMR